MRSFHAALGLALGLLPLTAAEPTYGIGLSLRQNEQTIYLPVQLSPSLRLEGSLQFANFTSKETDWDISQRDTTFGLGLFHVRTLGEGFQLYAGPRFSYGKKSQEHPVFTCTSDKTYGITPLLGLEYRLTRNLSLSGEAGVRWSQTESEYYEKSKPWRHSNTNNQWSTQTSVALRYWF